MDVNGEKNRAALRERLTGEQYRVTCECGTEPPFQNAYWDNHARGFYLDVISGELIFSSEGKFDSGTGWPSFTRPAFPEAVVELEDRTHGMARTEIRAARSGAHLGHVFDDGPASLGKRYCVNSAALRFVREEDSVAIVAAGCFWGTEAYFVRVSGVLSTSVGYAGGTGPASYEDVCAGGTGHAEAVRVVFDPERITYRDVLRHFFRMHDPTSVDRQGPDVGEQYRSAIFTVGEGQRAAAEALVRELADARAFATEISQAGAFYPAEEWHQRYLERNPRGYCHVNLSLAGKPLD